MTVVAIVLAVAFLPVFWLGIAVGRAAALGDRQLTQASGRPQGKDEPCPLSEAVGSEPPRPAVISEPYG